MTNMAGLFIIAAGVLFVVIGARGTQGVVFPGLFSSAGSPSNSSENSGGSNGS